jgi:hypothetical protein
MVSKMICGMGDAVYDGLFLNSSINNITPPAHMFRETAGLLPTMSDEVVRGA